MMWSAHHLEPGTNENPSMMWSAHHLETDTNEQLSMIWSAHVAPTCEVLYIELVLLLEFPKV